jgi:dTMP kinase
MNVGGKFIVLDGPDGSGKGTQLTRIADWLRTEARLECVLAKDPGGTPIGDRIRHVLLDFDLSAMDPTCEALLFMASRAQLVAELVRPALAAGKVVLGDRFISATCCYQVAAGYPRERVLELGRMAVGDTWPHLTILLDLPPEIGFERTGRKPRASSRAGSAGQLNMFDGARADAIERRPLDYHRRVRELFLELPVVYPTPVEIVDATRSADEVFAAMQALVRRVFA